MDVHSARLIDIALSRAKCLKLQQPLPEYQELYEILDDLEKCIDYVVETKTYYPLFACYHCAEINWRILAGDLKYVRKKFDRSSLGKQSLARCTRFAAWGGHLNVFQYCEAKCIEFDAEIDPPRLVHNAIVYGHYDLYEYIMDKYQIDPNRIGPLRYAAKNRQIAIDLLRRGATSSDILVAAAYAGHEDLVKEYIWLPGCDFHNILLGGLMGYKPDMIDLGIAKINDVNQNRTSGRSAAVRLLEINVHLIPLATFEYMEAHIVRFDTMFEKVIQKNGSMDLGVLRFLYRHCRHQVNTKDTLVTLANRNRLDSLKVLIEEFNLDVKKNVIKALRTANGEVREYLQMKHKEHMKRISKKPFWKLG